MEKNFTAKFTGQLLSPRNILTLQTNFTALKDEILNKWYIYIYETEDNTYI